MVKIILTDSYHFIFNLLCKELEKHQLLTQKNLVFCEEKASLTAERKICTAFNGAFNTEVYSFGNYLRVHKTPTRTLTKEGSTMVVKKILGTLPLSMLNKGREIAPTIFELIAQLKSAGIKPIDVYGAVDGARGILKNKLNDIALVFDSYEKYLIENELEDQNGALSQFPEIIYNLKEQKDLNVFIIGYNGLTGQSVNCIEALLTKANTFTAILPYGENEFAFVNETVKKIKDVATKLGKESQVQFVQTPSEKENRKIIEALFNPLKQGEGKILTDKIYTYSAKNAYEEGEKIACIIKQEVLKGKRYKDFGVILPENVDEAPLKKAFQLLEIPAYFDLRYRVENHPLITLIFSYIDCFVKRFERETVLSLIKNPLYSANKELNDEFINYVYKFNVNYSAFFSPFKFGVENSSIFAELENLRQKVAKDFEEFNLNAFLLDNAVEEKLKLLGEQLRLVGRAEEASVTEQIYGKIREVLTEINSVLGDVNDKKEIKDLLISGIMALKLSIIPQYNDAVFVGGFKESAQYETKNLFVCSLTSGVPSAKEDVALLNDNELDRLSDLKVFIEPKIKIVNHRAREETVVALSSFSEKLYLSYPVTAEKNGKNIKSEVFRFFENCFTVRPFPETGRFLSGKQGYKNFALDCANFTEWRRGDLSEAISFYFASDEEKAKNILDSANGEMVKQLENNKNIGSAQISPTMLEEYYKCPFRAFLRYTLGVKEREMGEINAISIGNLMHEIFYLFTKEVGKIDTVEQAVKLFNENIKKLEEDERYKIYFEQSIEDASLESLISECKRHCLNSFEFFKRSQFKPEIGNLERSFEISLANGKAKLCGKIDRVDTFGNYFRVIDYKTGKVDDSEEALFTGIKLQLWLYALAIGDKSLAGAYYFDAVNEYKSLKNKNEPILKGKTLDNVEVLSKQDEEFDMKGCSKYIPVTVQDGKVKGATTEKTLSAFIKYAEKMSEQAVEQMSNGVIIASPLKGTCERCKFRAVCMQDEGTEREMGVVKEYTIEKAVYGSEEDAQP